MKQAIRCGALWLALSATLGPSASWGAGPAGTAEVAWDGTSLRLWRSPGLGFEMSVPAMGAQIAVEPRQGTAGEPLESAVVMLSHTEAARVEVFSNLRGDSVQVWTAEQMGFLRDAASSLDSTSPLRGGAEHLELRFVRSVHSFPRTVYVFRSGDWVVRITAERTHDHACQALYRAIVSSFRAPGGVP
jgi:hypothetical protein